MAEKANVASLLNTLADPALLAVLSSRDKASMSEFVADYFYGDTDTEMSDSEEEEELGKSTLWLMLYKHCSKCKK